MSAPSHIWVQCFNYHPYTLGGSERSARELALGLRNRGHRVTIVLSDEVEPYPDNVDGIPIKVITGLQIGKSPLHKSRTFFDRAIWTVRSEIDPFLIQRLSNEIRIDPPDIVLINNPAGHGSAIMLAAEKCGVPFIPIIRDFGYYCAFGTMQKGQKICGSLCSICKIYSAKRRKIIHKIPTVIAISKYIAQLNKAILGSNNIKHIYNSISDVFIETPLQNRAPGPRALRFGYLGRLHDCKGVNQLLSGWGQSKISEQGHALHLAGDNQGIDFPYNFSGLNINYHGVQPAIEFLDQIDVLVIPSLWAEPFGRSVIEGIARGCYVVGSANGALPELISEDVGEIFPEVTSEGLKRVFQSISNNPERVFRSFQNSRTDTLVRFRREHMIDQYESTIKEVLNA